MLWALVLVLVGSAVGTPWLDVEALKRINADTLRKPRAKAARNALQPLNPISAIGGMIAPNATAKHVHFANDTAKIGATALLSGQDMQSQPEPLPTDKHRPQIHLIVQWFASTDQARRAEMDICLQKNLANPAITKVHWLQENTNDRPAFLQPSTRLATFNLGRRLTLKDGFDYAHKNLPKGSIAMIANADIFFDSSLTHLQTADFKDGRKVIMPSRYETFINGTVLDVQCSNYIGSHDVFIMKVPVADFGVATTLFSKLDYALGRLGVENRLIYELAHSDFYVTNPCNVLRTYHLHGDVPHTYHAGTAGERYPGERCDTETQSPKFCPPHGQVGPLGEAKDVASTGVDGLKFNQIILPGGGREEVNFDEETL